MVTCFYSKNKKLNIVAMMTAGVKVTKLESDWV